MFTPLGNTFAPPSPLTLVSTALPNSIALRVPSDNVAPSVSSAQLNNNASGNNVAMAKATTQTLAQTTNASAANFSVSTGTTSASYNTSTQSAFLAQLASQDISPEVHGIFVQYEKLLSYANVKYKPSNAGKPSDTESLFTTLLQREKSDSKYIPPVVEAQAQQEPAQPVETPVTIENFHEQQPVPQPPLPQLQTFKYIETVARNNNVELADVETA